MKARVLLIPLIMTLLIGFTSCGTYVKVKPKPDKVKNIPPGQVKKANGSKSAKPFAPGQKKKHGI